MKTSELTGAALDWAVAKCEGLSVYTDMRHDGWATFVDYSDQYCDVHYTPTTNWGWGGPIIEREVIVLTHPKHDCWTATAQDSTDLDAPLYQEDGPTPLIAAMRCYVASKLGDEVEIPEELK